jgi:hypothetical protein
MKAVDFMIFISTNNLGYPKNQRGNMQFIILHKKFKTEIYVMFSSLLREQELQTVSALLINPDF